MASKVKFVSGSKIPKVEDSSVVILPEGASAPRPPTKPGAVRSSLWKLRNYVPTPWQAEVHQSIHLPPLPGEPQFNSLNCGRGAGKTTMASELAWEGATADWNDGLGPPHVKIFADTYEHGQLIWDVIWQEAATVFDPLVHTMDTDRHLIWLKDPANPALKGASIQMLSADQERMLTGHNKTTLAITDESQFIKDSAWSQFRPCLNMRRGVHVGFGVCQGQGWYKTNSLRSLLTPEDWPDYRTMRIPSWRNPYMPREAIEQARSELPAALFTQLYEVDWVSEHGAVFENIENCIINSGLVIPLIDGQPLILTEPEPGVTYCAGVDIAQAKDYMTVAVLNRHTGRLVAALRVNKRSYTFQERLVADLLLRYGPLTYGDATSMGAGIFEHISNYIHEAYNNSKDGELPVRRVSMVPVTLATNTRQKCIDDLALALLHERVRFPNLKQLVAELKVFEKKIGPTGNVRMAAPEGMHDDMVFALALAVQGLPPEPFSFISGTAPRRVAGWER